MIEDNASGEKTKLFPEEVSSKIVLKMKVTAEAFLGAQVNEVVVALPAHFNGGFEVKATAGNTHLGEDFDNRIVDFCLQDFALAVPAMAATAKHLC